MIGASKILTVSYGTFSCTLEGFEEPFNTMKAIAEYFRDLAADDRYFGAEPPTPDAAMLHRIAEREIQRRVEAKIQDNGVILRAGDLVAQPVQPAPAVAPAAPVVPMPAPAPAAVTGGLLAEESVAAKLQRIRSAVARSAVVAAPAVVPDTVEEAVFVEDEHAEAVADAAPDLADAETAAEDGTLIDTLRDDWQAIDEAGEEAEAALAIEADEDLRAVFDAAAANDDAPILADAPHADTSADDALLAAIAVSESEAAALPLDDLPEVLAEAAALPEDILPEDVLSEDLVPEDYAATAAVAGDAVEDDLIAGLAAGAEIDEPQTDDLSDLLDTIAAEATAAMPEDAEVVSDEPYGMDDDLALEAALEDDMAEEDVADLSRFDRSDVSEAELIEDDGFEEEVFENAAFEGEAYEIEIAEIAAEPVAAGAAPGPLTLTEAERADHDEAHWPADPMDDTAPAELPAAEKLRRARARVIKVRRPGDEAAIAPAAPVLSPEAEAELQHQLAADQDNEDRPAEREGRTILEANAKGDEDVTRLLRQTNTEMDGPENRRRMSTLAHLKAAVAATVAELRSPGAPSENGEASRLDRYRADLARVVRPRRGSDAPVAERPAPLVLVSEQRIDRPAPTPVDTVPARIMPRRITAGNLAIDEDDDASDAEEAENIFASSKNFVEFAERLGASDLPDLLEAAAAYTACIEGRPHFTRPHLMRHVAALTEDNDQSREDSMRSFGQLLRQGKIEKVKRGQFAITDTSHYLAEARRMAR